MQTTFAQNSHRDWNECAESTGFRIVLPSCDSELFAMFILWVMLGEGIGQVSEVVPSMVGVLAAQKPVGKVT